MSIRNLEEGTYTVNNINATGNITAETISSNENLEIGGGLRFPTGQYVEYPIVPFTATLGAVKRLSRTDVGAPAAYGGSNPAVSWTAGAQITLAKDGVYLISCLFTSTIPANTELNCFVGNALAVPSTSQSSTKILSSGTNWVSGTCLFETSINTLQVGFDVVDLGGGGNVNITSGKLQILRIL